MKKIITHSELQCAKDCLQKWEYRYAIGWRRKIVSPTVLFGAGMHRALEVHYLGGDVSEGYRAIESVFQDYLINHANNLPDIQPYKDTCELTKKVFTNYVDNYRENDVVPIVDPITGKPLVEMEFLIPVYTPSGRASKLFLFAGKIDAIVEFEKEFWVLEHKTRAEINESSYERLVMDQQTRAYCFAAQVYLGIPIAGVIYNLIRRKVPGKPKINKNGTVSLQKVDTTVDLLISTLVKQDEYLCSLGQEERKRKKLACGIDFDKYAPEISRLRKVKFFDRHVQRYDEEDYKSIQMEIYQVSLMLHQARWFYRNDAACDHWGGCPYRPLCMGLDPEEHFIISSQKHTELRLHKENIHLPLGRGYRIEAFEEKIGMSGILDAVNA